MRIEQIVTALLQLLEAADTLTAAGHRDASDVISTEVGDVLRKYGLEGLSQAELADLTEGVEVESGWRFAIVTRGHGGVTVWDWYRSREDASNDPRVREGHAEAVAREDLPEEYTVEIEVN